MNMDNKENEVNKVTETLTKELESLSTEGLTLLVVVNGSLPETPLSTVINVLIAAFFKG